jgi:hypothetical protein
LTSYDYFSESDFEEIDTDTGTLNDIQTCEYCQRRMPIIMSKIILIRSYDYRGRIVWRCNDCAEDMKK